MLKDLLRIELLKLFSVSESDVTVEMNDVQIQEFDLLDKVDSSVVPPNKGNVTYHNETGTMITAFNYEKFIHSLSDEKKKYVKSCDFIVFNEESFFICNELSFGNPASKWPKAWKQMLETIKKLTQSSSLSQVLGIIPNKFCIFSSRHNQFTSPMGIADSFNIPTLLIKGVQEREWKPINSLGYRVFEADNIFWKKNNCFEFSQTSC